MRVFLAQEPLELRGVAPQHLRNLLRIETGQSFGQMVAGLIVDPYGVARGEPTTHLHDAGGQQTRLTATHRLRGTLIGHQRAKRVRSETDP